MLQTGGVEAVPLLSPKLRQKNIGFLFPNMAETHVQTRVLSQIQKLRQGFPGAMGTVSRPLAQPDLGS